MIHIALLTRGAQKTSRQRETGRALQEGDQYRKEFFKEQREAGREVI